MMGVQKWHVINDREAAEYCTKYASIRLAHQMYLKNHSEAMVSPANGKPITFQALHSAAWRYIITHPVEGRALIADGYSARGIVLDDETWKVLQATHSKAVFSFRRREKFLKEQGLEAYRDRKS